MRRTFALALCLSFAIPAAAADYAAGVAAAQAEDWDKAMEEWLPLAEQGVAGAQMGVGQLFALGLGVDKDPVQALHWHLLAAQQGVVQSQVFVGLAYAGGGGGVEKDMLVGQMWLRIAERFGDPEARNALFMISQNLPQELIDEAQRLADEWQPAPPPN